MLPSDVSASWALHSVRREIVDLETETAGIEAIR